MLTYSSLYQISGLSRDSYHPITKATNAQIEKYINPPKTPPAMKAKYRLIAASSVNNPRSSSGFFSSGFSILVDLTSVRAEFSTHIEIKEKPAAKMLNNGVVRNMPNILIDLIPSGEDHLMGKGGK